MDTVTIEENGKAYRFLIPASAGGAIEFFPAGYDGEYYAVQDYKDGEAKEYVTGGVPAHTQRGGSLPCALLVFQTGEVVKGKEVRMK